MSEAVSRLTDIVRTLRSPEGCPWDREQTHESLRGALLEECYEAIEAINNADDANLREELGDLLLLVVMHAQMGTERGAFAFEEIATTVCEKMIRRHPHVFGDKSAEDSTAVLKQWEQIKRQERGENASVLAGLAKALPALMRAQNVQKKVARVGFDWGSAVEVLDKVEEEIRELREAMTSGGAAEISDECGDVFFSVVNLARKLGLESETVLNESTNKFIRRFQLLEGSVAAEGNRVEELSLEALEQHWQKAKLA